jgi:anti-sigma-K factor RskA
VRCASQLDVGAYVLDALEPDEQQRMQVHVQGCPVCAETVRELEGLPRLLAGVPAPGETPVAPSPSELAFERFRRSAALTPAPRRRAPRWRLAAAAAVLAVAGGVATGVAVSTRDEPAAVVQAVSGNVHARASLAPVGDGTRIMLSLDGLPYGAKCELVAVARNGSEQSAGTWSVTYDGTYQWTGWVAVGPGQLDRLVVRTLDGRTLVSLPA